MRRLFQYSSLGLALLIAGGVAGQRLAIVPDSEHRDHLQRSMADDTPTEPAVDRTAEAAWHSDEIATEPAVDVTSEDESVDDFAPQFASLTHVKPDATDESSEPAAVDQQVVQQIQRVFPDADAQTVAVWAESFSGLGMDDVEFLLQQKLAITGPSGSLISSTIDVPPVVPESPSGVHESSGSDGLLTLEEAIAIVESNLRNAWTPGFRRTVVFPEPLPAAQSEQTLATSFRAQARTSFDGGRTTTSTHGLHVSLSDNEPLAMFRLADGRLTRRGDFRLLSDRRIGLLTAAGEISLDGSPVIPVDHDQQEITPDGRLVTWSTLTTSAATDSTVIEHGRITIVRVSDTTVLDTADGVWFRTGIMPGSETLNEILLKTGSLELSNVDITDEQQLLDQLLRTRAAVGSR